LFHQDLISNLKASRRRALLFGSPDSVSKMRRKQPGIARFVSFCTRIRINMLSCDGEARTMSASVRPIGIIALASTLLASALAAGLPAPVAFAVDCVTAPNPAAPPNSHWYYRTDRTQQQKCWYLRANSGAPEQRAMQVAREAPPENSTGSVSQAGKYSLASFKEFMAQRGGAKLSDEDVKTLYLQFLEWSHRANN
jgi:hypothetical protein